MEEEQEILDLEAELDRMLEADATNSVVTTILEQAGTLTLADLRELGKKMPEARDVTLAQMFSEFKRMNGLVSKV